MARASTVCWSASTRCCARCGVTPDAGGRERSSVRDVTAETVTRDASTGPGDTGVAHHVDRDGRTETDQDIADREHVVQGDPRGHGEHITEEAQPRVRHDAGVVEGVLAVPATGIDECTT